MLIIYDSRTHNVERFVQKLSSLKHFCLPIEHVNDLHGVTLPYLLITYTDKLGEVPERTTKFLKEHSSNLVGVASSGNRNFGKHFATASNTIAENFNVPVVHKFELAGVDADVKIIEEWIENYENLQNT